MTSTAVLPMETLSKAYNRALDVQTIQALWDLQQTIPDTQQLTFDIATMLRLDSDVQVDKCMFFAKHKMLTLKQLYECLLPQKHTKYWNKLFGALYHDIDFV